MYAASCRIKEQGVKKESIVGFFNHEKSQNLRVVVGWKNEVWASEFCFAVFLWMHLRIDLGICM